MTILRLVPIIGLMATLSACASIMDGHTQEISVSTSPEGAKCDIVRNGNHIANIKSTPQTVLISRNSSPLYITCKKEPNREGNFRNAAGWNQWFWGNFIFGGLLGLGIDAGTGNWDEYPQSINIPLIQSDDAVETTTAPTQATSNVKQSSLPAQIAE